jgi:hypothetical protein
MPGINAIALDATHVYASFAGDRALIKVPKAGGQVTVLAVSQDDPGLNPFFPGPLAVGDGVLYWGDFGIFKVPTAGGPSSVVAQLPSQIVNRMAVTGRIGFDSRRRLQNGRGYGAGCGEEALLRARRAGSTRRSRSGLASGRWPAGAR